LPLDKEVWFAKISVGMQEIIYGLIFKLGSG